MSQELKDWAFRQSDEKAREMEAWYASLMDDFLEGEAIREVDAMNETINLYELEMELIEMGSV